MVSLDVSIGPGKVSNQKVVFGLIVYNRAIVYKLQNFL